MSVPVDTGNTEKRRGGKKLRLLIPAAAVVLLAAALVWVNSVYVYAGGFHRRDSAQIDLRGKSISEGKYLRLCEQMPDCEILWDVPIGGGAFSCESEAVAVSAFSKEDVARLTYFPALTALDLTAADVSPALFDAVHAAYPALSVRWSIPIGEGRYPSDAESIVLTDFASSELPLFAYFTALRAADARECMCYDALLALREEYPALELEWQVPLGGTEYLDTAAEIAVDDVSLTPEALAAALRYLPAAETVSFPACPWSETEKDALRAEFPDIAFVWPVEIFGTTYESDTAELSFASRALSEAELSELSEKLVSLPKLTRVDLTGTGVALEQMTQLCEKYPAVDFVFSFELFGVPISTGDTFLDFTGIEMESTETVESIFPVMHHLEKVDMTDTGFDDETLDAMDRRWENIRVVWTMHIDAQHYDVRTDATGFIASFDFYGILTPESLHRFKYCHDMLCADFGHRITFQDMSALSEMPQLQYLLLADCWSQDITPVGTLENLVYFEMVLGLAKDLTPLLNCKNLLDLNVCFCYYTDPETNLAVFKQMTQLERLWISVGMIPEGTEQELRDALPNTEIQLVVNKNDATAFGWRYHERYYKMRDLLGVFYMGELGGRQYSKIIDGVEYPLSEEFLAQQNNVVHAQGHIDYAYN